MQPRSGPLIPDRALCHGQFCHLCGRYEVLPMWSDVQTKLASSAIPLRCSPILNRHLMPIRQQHFSGVIDSDDLAAVLAAWNTDGVKNPRADTNSDGVVNAADLALVLSKWGSCAKTPCNEQRRVRPTSTMSSNPRCRCTRRIRHSRA